ncbi:MAG: CRISPR-associated endonuclease Cas3'' [Armatimonadota bacterium]
MRKNMNGHPEYYAHTPNQNGKWHLLRDHLLGVARLAETFASSFYAGKLGRLLGILHDLGKASNEFQDYLRQCHKALSEGRSRQSYGPDHKLVGARKALRICQPLVLPILGHHGGLVDKATAKGMLDSNSTTDQQHDHILHILGIGNVDQE